MGGGIAQVCAAAGFAVVLVDTDVGALERARTAIARGLGIAVSKGGLSKSEGERALSRLTGTPSFDALGSCDAVIEAIPENTELKLGLFRDLDAIAPGAVFLASNTSSISITALARATCRPERVLGLHFMNPVPVMKLVELVRGMHTSDAVVALGRTLAERLGKTVVVARDHPGFIVNRILIPMINEAVFALQEGVASAAEIDAAMRLGANQPLGPLALADLIGLDICLDISELLHRELGEDKYRPCPLLRRQVAAGYLGKKTGRGFFRYPP